jgi:hypothetical protein
MKPRTDPASGAPSCCRCRLSSHLTLGEGNTPHWDAPRSAAYAGVDRLAVKHQGMNPTGSFKDNGMTTGVTQARALGATTVAWHRPALASWRLRCPRPNARRRVHSDSR